MDHNERELARQRHETLEYIGVRAQATMVGLSQLCSELLVTGALSQDAVERIKDAIVIDIVVSRPRIGNRAASEFDDALRSRLDAIFPRGEQAERSRAIGTSVAMQADLTNGIEDIQGSATNG